MPIIFYPDGPHAAKEFVYQKPCSTNQENRKELSHV